MYPNDPTNKVDLIFQAQRPPIHLNQDLRKSRREEAETTFKLKE